MTHFRFALVAFIVLASSVYSAVKYPELFNDPVKFFEKSKYLKKDGHNN